MQYYSLLLSLAACVILGKLATVPSLDVKFVARGETLRVLRDNGLTLRTVGGDQVIRSFTATDRLEEVGEVDVVLVCTKAWQVSSHSTPPSRLMQSARSGGE